MAVISFDFAATASCPSTNPFVVAHAVTSCSRPENVVPLAPLTNLPSIAMWFAPVASHALANQSVTTAANAFGLSIEKSRTIVSALEIPFANGRTFFSHDSCSTANR